MLAVKCLKLNVVMYQKLLIHFVMVLQELFSEITIN
jgi:hypothetical protein